MVEVPEVGRELSSLSIDEKGEELALLYTDILYNKVSCLGYNRLDILRGCISFL